MHYARLTLFCFRSDLSEEKHEAKLNGIEENDQAHKFIYESKLFHHVQSTAKTVNVELSKRKQHFYSF